MPEGVEQLTQRLYCDRLPDATIWTPEGVEQLTHRPQCSRLPYITI
jgi:hypothetical protein